MINDADASAAQEVARHKGPDAFHENRSPLSVGEHVEVAVVEAASHIPADARPPWSSVTAEDGHSNHKGQEVGAQNVAVVEAAYK